MTPEDTELEHCAACMLQNKGVSDMNMAHPLYPYLSFEDVELIAEFPDTQLLHRCTLKVDLGPDLKRGQFFKFVQVFWSLSYMDFNNHTECSEHILRAYFNLKPHQATPAEIVEQINARKLPSER